MKNFEKKKKNTYFENIDCANLGWLIQPKGPNKKNNMPCVPSIHPKLCINECWFILIDKLVVIKTCGVFNGLKRIIHNSLYIYIYINC
jgi:hypothetical protein